MFEWEPPTFRWFVGGKTNLGYNAVDRHVLEGNGGRAALVYINERGDRVVQTYAQLLHAVKRVSAALRALGIGKGDRLTIYMPPCPESIALMLATVRIGAIHSVVFAGFGAQALGDRIAASGSRVVFATDVVYRKGQNVPLLSIVDEALKLAGNPSARVVVLERDSCRRGGAYASWEEFLRGGEGHDSGHAVMFYDGIKDAAPGILSGNPPAGAFYAFLKINPAWAKEAGVTGESLSWAMAEHLIKGARIGCVPGVDFGAATEGYLRFCTCRSREELQGALASMKALFAGARV